RFDAGREPDLDSGNEGRNDIGVCASTPPRPRSSPRPSLPGSRRRSATEFQLVLRKGPLPWERPLPSARSAQPFLEPLPLGAPFPAPPALLPRSPWAGAAPGLAGLPDACLPLPAPRPAEPDISLLIGLTPGA